MAYAQSGAYPTQTQAPTHYYEEEYYEEGPVQPQQRQPMQRPPPQHQGPPPGQRPMNQRPPPIRNYGNGPPPPQGMNGGPPPGRGLDGPPGPGRGGMPPNPQRMGNGPRPPPPNHDDRMYHMQNGPSRAGPGIEEGMRNMNMNDGRNYNGPPPQQRQRLPNGRPPPPPQGYPDEMYGGSPQQRPPPRNGALPPRGPPQRQASHGDFRPRNGPPPPQGLQQRQGPPPPVRNYGGIQQDNWNGEQYDAYQDGGQQYGNGNGNGRMAPPERMRTPGNQMPQRSMTMPVRGNEFMSPPQNMGNHQQPRVLPQHDPNGFPGPRGYGQPPPIMEHNIPPAGYNHQGHHEMPGAILPEQYEYQVNEVLDSYYDGGDQQHYDGPAEYSYQQEQYQGPRGTITPPAAPAKTQLEGFDPSWESPQPNSNTAFAAHAHRSRSQPDLREGSRNSGQSGYSQHSQFAPVEMEGDIPSLPTSPRSGTFPAQSELPPVLRVKTPAPGQRPSPASPPVPMPPMGMGQFSPPPQQPPHGSMPQIGQQYTPPPNGGQYPLNVRQYSPPNAPQNPPPNAQQYPPQNGYPPRMQSVDALPYHPSPPQSNRSSNPDSLPEHATPVRPGLMRDQNSPMGPGHPAGPPPPVRQYAARDSMDNRSQQGPPPKLPLTADELAKAVQMAKAAPNDQALQLALAKKYIEAADVLADEGGKADPKTAKKNRENYIFDAHKLIKKLATGSHPYPEAMFFLAQCHGDGALGLQVDRERAFSLYHSAAKLNHPQSAYRTAVCCEIGAGTKKDPIKSVQWYKKAASLGDTGAMYKLGIILLKGLLGQQKSTRDALSWLKRAADQADVENPHALHELGLLYERADGRDQSIIPDINYARELFTKAADLGYAPSQFRLGHAYEFGIMGCPIDPRKSIAWYSRAAVKGEPDSELALSGWYLTGAEGVLEQSDTEAYLWARRAAEKGLPKAEYAVGHLTEAGFGVPPNMEEAKRWYYKAASQGFPKAQERLRDLKKGGAAGQQKQRERLSRSNVRKEDDCTIM